VAGMWALQRRLIYFPDTTPVGDAARTISWAEDVTLRTADGLELGAWLVPARPEADRGWAVLALPGNGGSRVGRAGLAELLSREGFTVLLVDYRGYGGNPGEPSEEGLARDADAAAQLLEDEGFSKERTLYLGESLGTGVAAALASRRPPAGLVLRSPFTDLAALGAHHYPWLPVGLVLRDRFPVVEHVRDSPVPTVVIHGTADEVVPSSQSAEVAAVAPVLVAEKVVPGAGHNDPVMFGRVVVDAVTGLVDRLQRG
jgi:uncharacterized protein